MINLKFWILILILSFTWKNVEAQKTITTSGISFTYTIQGDNLECTLEAKTNGWIGVGFNDKNSIVNSDLLLFNIINGEASSTDLYVKGIGNPRKDSDLGGANTITLLNSIEKRGVTRVVFSIPLKSGDTFDFEHRLNESYWLILAYSVEDDFNHHSRFRKHLPFKLEVPK
ncbi:DOMON domain-containing protein [Aquimarina gracilis]|uniref:DOMON domain-containing protein n=1 Tax=Aquimarina gracilis TaxID=874422 RepID=A0ABU5ZP36_9FLAO|nr:DOMON domain-containing protein [Aquimarina gracilis]MEB3343904.1 DOMON domain-containing protein [Aquimarina gracilis]